MSKANIDCLRELVEYMRTEIDKDMSVQMIAIVIEVAAKHQITFGELMKNLDMLHENLARNVKKLQTYRAEKDGPLLGYDLLQAYPGTCDTRSYVVELSEHGKNVMEEMVCIIRKHSGVKD